MSEFFTTEAVIALVTLTVLEIVLGIDNNTGAHFGDLLVSGTYYSDGRNLSGTAHVRVVAPFGGAGVLADFGVSGSKGVRIA